MGTVAGGGYEVLRLSRCTVLGSYGHDFHAGDTADLIFYERSLTISRENASECLGNLEISSIEIAGPGTVTTGGGFIGGGFGVSGALEGIAIASILNALTSRTKIHTFLSLVTHSGELHVHYSEMEPSALRMAMAGIFSALRRQDPAWIKAQLDRLEAAHAANAIDDAEYQRLTQRLTVEPQRPPLELRKGKCPSCDSEIPLLSRECPKCRANFSPGAAWSVKPI